MVCAISGATAGPFSNHMKLFESFGLRNPVTPVATLSPLAESYVDELDTLHDYEYEYETEDTDDTAHSPAPTSTQYYNQDDSGMSTFGYSYTGQSAFNMRDALGNQIGGWAYTNPEGKEIRVTYIADSNGYRVISNDLPVAPTPVTETPEVAAARAEHMAIHAAIRSRFSTTPRTVEETHEKIAAIPERISRSLFRL